MTVIVIKMEFRISHTVTESVGYLGLTVVRPRIEKTVRITLESADNAKRYLPGAAAVNQRIFGNISDL